MLERIPTRCCRAHVTILCFVNAGTRLYSNTFTILQIFRIYFTLFVKTKCLKPIRSFRIISYIPATQYSPATFRARSHPFPRKKMTESNKEARAFDERRQFPRCVILFFSISHQCYAKSIPIVVSSSKSEPPNKQTHIPRHRYILLNNPQWTCGHRIRAS